MTEIIPENKNIIDIKSPANKSFREWNYILTGKGIKKYNKTLVSGEKLLNELIAGKPEIVLGCIISSKRHTVPGNFPEHLPIFRLRGELFRELDMYATGYPLLLVKVPELQAIDSGTFEERILPLIPFQDPANLGAVVRSAAAFGIRRIILLQESASPFHPKSIRASSAQVFHVDFFQGPSISDLKDIGIPIVALASDGEDIRDFTFPERFAILPGVEGPGLPDGLDTDFRVAIPIVPNVESLNASVAVSIALYEWRKRIC